MPNKIFISYRREDTAANALGIGQYLEHQFGHKNVFIDVDMRAGAKFPDVLQQRLSECKVLIALIGPGWLNAHDERGRRRLDNPDDWVRLEIAHALRRDVTVIPVRVNGAALPTRDELPDNVRGLLDHQAVSITTTGFRNEMAGLARDIRAIPSTRVWRRSAAVAASVFVVLAASALIYSFGSQRLLRHPIAQTPPSATQAAIWSGKPGEWVMFATNNTPAAYYFKPSSVRMFGDKLAYTARVPLKIVNETKPSNQTAVYQDEESIVDCKTAKYAQAEVTFYNRAGEVISHFKRLDPSTADMSSVGQPLAPNSIAAIAQHLLCNEQLRTPLLTRQGMKLLFLAPTVAGDGDMFHGAVKPNADKSFPFSVVVVTKSHKDMTLASFFPGQSILGLPPNYWTAANPVQIDCAGRRMKYAKTEYYDGENNLIDVAAPINIEPFDIKEGASPLSLLFDLVCIPSGHGVDGTYEGTNTSTYKSGGDAEQRITIQVTQSGDDLTVSFQTPTGGQGKGEGQLSGDTVKSLTLQSTAPGCPGSYKGSLKFAGDTMSWSFEGSDCGGSMEGRGIAKRTKT